MLVLAWEGCQGAEAAIAVVSKGTTVPCAPNEKTFPQWLGQVIQTISLTQTSEYPVVRTGTLTQPLWQPPAVGGGHKVGWWGPKSPPLPPGHSGREVRVVTCCTNDCVLCSGAPLFARQCPNTYSNWKC